MKGLLALILGAAVGIVLAVGIVAAATPRDVPSTSRADGPQAHGSVEPDRVSRCPCARPDAGGVLWGGDGFWNDRFQVQRATASGTELRLVDSDLRTLTVRQSSPVRQFATCEMSNGRVGLDIPLNPATGLLDACKADLYAFAEHDGIAVR